MHRSVSEVLSHLGHGHTAIDIRDMEMRGESDEAIFRFAQKHKAALLSGDIGFARNVRFAKSEHYGIVVVRFPNELSTSGLISRISPTFLASISTPRSPMTLIPSRAATMRPRRSSINRRPAA